MANWPEESSYSARRGLDDQVWRRIPSSQHSRSFSSSRRRHGVTSASPAVAVQHQLVGVQWQVVRAQIRWEKAIFCCFTVYNNFAKMIAVLFGIQPLVVWLAFQYCWHCLREFKVQSNSVSLRCFRPWTVDWTIWFICSVFSVTLLLTVVGLLITYNISYSIWPT